MLSPAKATRARETGMPMGYTCFRRMGSIQVHTHTYICEHMCCLNIQRRCYGNVAARCSRCSFVKYCGAACQRADWQDHKQVCADICSDNWNRVQYKSGHRMFYGPVDQYYFELIRHLGQTTPRLFYSGPWDFSLPHKLMDS